MRHPITLSLRLAALSWTSAQDATPVKQTPGQAQAGAPFKQVVYESLLDHTTLTLTGPDTVAAESEGHKLTGTYKIEGKTMHVVITTNAPPESSAPPSIQIDYTMVADGILSDAEHGEMLPTA